jgi:hypothetical protein
MSDVEFELCASYSDDLNYIRHRNNNFTEQIYFDIEKNKLTKFIMKKHKYLIKKK